MDHAPYNQCFHLCCPHPFCRAAGEAQTIILPRAEEALGRIPLPIALKTIRFVSAIVLTLGATGCDFNFGSCSGSATRNESQLWVFDVREEATRVVVENWGGGPIVGISPDEQRVYSQPGRMEVWNLPNGSSHVLGLEASDERVDLSPDASRIALQRLSPGSQIWLSDAEGIQISVLLPNRFYSTFDPTWLGDSRRLAFVGYRDNMSTGGVYVFDVEDSTLTTLFEDRFSGYDITPDGSAVGYEARGLGRTSMRLKRAGGEKVEDLGRGFFPRITSSGDRVVYAYEYNGSLMSVRADGTSRIDLMHDWIDTGTVELSPSGAAVSVATGTGLWLIDVADGSRQRLVDAASLELVDDPWDGARVRFRTPTFNGDGTKIYFVVERELYHDGCPND